MSLLLAARVPAARGLLRGGAVATAALALASVHVARPTTLCPLRAVTGVPCPMCGGTTAAVALGRGDLPAAIAASPLLVLGLALLVLAPRQVLERLRSIAPVRIWVTIGLVAGLSELWQLHRFGFL